jgi:DNA-directed RNA polymerase specialized sigma24 family protein
MLMPTGLDQDDLASWNLAQLAQRCAVEQQLYRQHAPSDDRYCLELFLRAIKQRDERAWDVIYHQFSGTVLGWLRQHPYAHRLRNPDEHDDHITTAFRKFWLATASPGAAAPHFPTLASVLAYLRSCLNSVVLDEMRQLQSRQREESLERSSPITEDPSPEPLEELSRRSLQELWPVIERALPDRRERRLVYLLFVQDLKPREVVEAAPDDFPTAQEVYRLTRNVLDRLRRNPALRAWREHHKQ